MNDAINLKEYKFKKYIYTKKPQYNMGYLIPENVNILSKSDIIINGVKHYDRKEPNYPKTIATWNILNLNDKFHKTKYTINDKKKVLQKIVNTNPDIIVLQESMNEIGDIVGYTHFKSEKNNWVVSVYHKNKFNFYVKTFCHRDKPGKCAIILHNSDIIIVGVHFPFYNDGLEDFFNNIITKIKQLENNDKIPIIFVGDMNLEKNVKNIYHDSLTKLLNGTNFKVCEYFDKNSVKTTNGDIKKFDHMFTNNELFCKHFTEKYFDFWNDAELNLKTKDYPSDHTPLLYTYN
jgi:endonuclease/exonuclease/phosphatase family metal-dependent hydrolase